MGQIFNIHWRLRKGLGPEWIDKVSDIGLDDLPLDVTVSEARQIAIDEFKMDRYKNGTTEREYIITDVCLG